MLRVKSKNIGPYPAMIAGMVFVLWLAPLSGMIGADAEDGAITGQDLLTAGEALAFTEPTTGPEEPRLPQAVKRVSAGERIRIFLPSFLPWLVLILLCLLIIQHLINEKEKGKNYGQIWQDGRARVILAWRKLVNLIWPVAGRITKKKVERNKK